MNFSLNSLTCEGMISKPECQTLIDQTSSNLNSANKAALLAGLSLCVILLILCIKEKEKNFTGPITILLAFIMLALLLN